MIQIDFENFLEKLTSFARNTFIIFRIRSDHFMFLHLDNIQGGLTVGEVYFFSTLPVEESICFRNYNSGSLSLFLPPFTRFLYKNSGGTYSFLTL